MRVIREERSTRLRASLRVLIPAVGTLVLLTLFNLARKAILGQITGTSTVLGLLGLLTNLVTYVVLILVAVWSGAKLERRDYGDFGLNVDGRWIRNFVAGTAISTFGIALSLLWGKFRGLREVDLSVVGVNGGVLVPAVVLVGFACMFLLGNVYEEVIFRRIAIRNLAEGFAARGFSPVVAVVPATGVSMVLFGLYHVPLRGNFVVAVDAAMVAITFSLAYLLTEDLGLPTGIHFGRISTEVIYGGTIAGVELPAVVEFTRATLLANLEVKLVRLGVVCLLVIAWVYLSRGELRTAEVVQRPNDARSDAD